MDAQIAINKRYKNLTCDNLSCGNNMGFAKLKAGEMVLDLGCGSGRESIEAAKIVGPLGRVTGVDLTTEMVIKAHERAFNDKVSNVHFITANIEQLPLPKESYNAIISNCVINHSPNKLKVFGEIYRVLKSGGRFIISDAVTKYTLPPEVKNDPQAWADCYGGAIMEAEYLAIVKQSGFQRIEILNKREYLKNGFEFASLTLLGFK